MQQQRHCPKINFTFSQAALAAIENIRIDWTRKFPGDPPDILWVSWGQIDYDNGQKGECVLVSFYKMSMRAELLPLVQKVQGYEVIFFTVDEFAPLFEGKVIDYTRERFFFLRSP